MQGIVLGRSKETQTQAEPQETINLFRRVRQVLCKLHPRESKVSSGGYRKKDQGHFLNDPTSK